MTRTSLAVVVAILLITAGGAPLVSAATTTTTTPETDVQPGERLSGVVGVEGTELQSDFEQRVFGQQMAAANSNASKADIVASEVTALEDRLAELRDRKAALEQALDNNSISRGEYAARMAQLVAQERALTRMLNVTADAANGLPASVLEANGVNVSAIQQLRENAANLTGPEIAAIARQIAGPPSDRGNASDDGPPGQASAAIQQADAAIQTAERQIEQAAAQVSEDNDTLEQARDTLEDAKETLQNAKAAAANGNLDEARSLAADAQEMARTAADLAREASQSGSGPPDDDDETTTTGDDQTTTRSTTTA